MKRLLVCRVLLATSFCALAQWFTKSEDDVFSGGKKSMVIAIDKW
jgi:hypothetical protein